jgi:hypothetical protein
MLGVCVSAGTLAILDWSRLWWFLPIAVGSYAFALLGYVAAKRRWQGWLQAHLTGQGGSYIAMVTALFVVNWETLTGTRGVVSPWAWALPTVVGSPIIAWVTREVAFGRRPKLYPCREQNSVIPTQATCYLSHNSHTTEPVHERRSIDSCITGIHKVIVSFR